MMCASLYIELSTRKDIGMSPPDGDPPRPRRVFDFDTLVDYAGVLLAVPLIVIVTWLFLGPTHISLGLSTQRIDEVLTAAALDVAIAVIVAIVFLLRQRPATGLIWRVLISGIFVSLCVGWCWLMVELANYWSQPK
jgi:hypothetical protein